MTKDLCNTCKHYFGDLQCTAFPERIPNQILVGNSDHEKPLPNQKGPWVYEPRDP